MTTTVAPQRTRPSTSSDGPDRRERLRPQWTALLVGLVPASLVAARAVWRDADGAWRLSLFDDAMISMSYARTVAGGDGLVWFPGADVVEGITNLSWGALMALLHAVGLSGSQVAAVMMLISLGTVWCAAIVARRLVEPFSDGSAQFSFAAVLVVAANVPLVFWAVRGMEVGLITLAVLTACWLVLGATERPGWSPRTAAALAAVVAVGMSTRMDFVVVPICLAVWLLVDGSKQRWRLVAVMGASVVIVLAALTAFRYAYYGELLPNTYHLKASGVSMSVRLTRGLGVGFVAAGAYLVPPSVLIAVAWRSLSAQQRRIVRMLVIVAAGHLSYSTWVGGDAWEWFLLPNRYLTPGLVVLSLAAVVSTFAAVSSPAAAPRARAGIERRWVAATVLIGAGPLVTVRADDLVGDRIPAWAGLTASPGFRLLGPAVLVALLAALFGGWSRRRDELRDESSTGVVSRRFAFGLAVLLVLSGGFRVTQVLVDDGNRFSQLGAQLAAVTDSDATIAVGAAGGTQYWSQRPMVDLLGKNDPVVARSEPATPHFVPGHNKFDLDHSLDVLRPDVVAQGVAADELLARGFVPVLPLAGSFSGAIPHEGQQVIFVRPASDAVRWDRLRRLE